MPNQWPYKAMERLWLLGILNRNGNAFTLVRYNSDGSLDAGFDGDGKVQTPLFYNGTNSYAVPNPWQYKAMVRLWQQVIHINHR